MNCCGPKVYFSRFCIRDALLHLKLFFTNGMVREDTNHSGGNLLFAYSVVREDTNHSAGGFCRQGSCLHEPFLKAKRRIYLLRALWFVKTRTIAQEIYCSRTLWFVKTQTIAQEAFAAKVRVSTNLF